MEIKLKEIKENITEEGRQMILWNGYHFYIGELLYKENDVYHFLCGSSVIDDAISFDYLPDQPERLNPEDQIVGDNEKVCDSLNSMET